MILKKRIPKDFYKLFRTKNMDHYMLLLAAVYEENSKGYAAVGLTVEECRSIIAETIVKAKMEWIAELEEGPEADAGAAQQSGIPGADAGTAQHGIPKTPAAGGAAMEGDAQEPVNMGIVDTAPSAILKRLIGWGWLKSDYDERLNSYILSFPEYSRLFVELFQKLQNEDDSGERESILAIYSALFTYHSDPEKNNDILKNALRTSRNLGQLLSNMRDGMRSYFDELSGRKNFIGIQEVLVEELNNSDSKKYAILTTTDSFYRYKEAVKELVSRIMNDNEQKKSELERKLSCHEKGSMEYMRTERALMSCGEAGELVYQVEREFDRIERKYNKLIEQKAVFAKRALARIRYILQEGANEEDAVLRFIRLLDRSGEADRLLEELSEKVTLTTQFHAFRDNSLYSRRDSGEEAFSPVIPEKAEAGREHEITDFVPKPLYTKKQLDDFKEKNMKDGVFAATEETVQSLEDLEKLLLLWQEAAETGGDNAFAQVGRELRSGEGFTFSELIIDERRKDEDVTVQPD